MLSRIAFLCSVVAAPLLASTGPVSAQDFQMTLFGHAVEISQTDDGQSLVVDGESLLTDYVIFIERIAEVDGVPVAIGTASAGGNACEGAPFVLAIGPGASVRLDGPLDTCSPIKPVEEPDRLVFTEPAVPGSESQRWAWTPENDFKNLDTVSFSPDEGKGWAQLRQDEIGHPADMLSYGDVARQADELLGEDKQDFYTLLTGLGSAERAGSLLFGSACVKFDCPDNTALMVADLAAQRVYLAWKPAGSKIVVRPQVGDWPEDVRAVLRDWAAPWN